MVDTDGAAHVSKPMPVNVVPPVRAESAATGEAGCAAVDAMLLGVGTGVAGEGAAGVWADDRDELTVEARTLSIDVLSAPHVASTSTP